MITYTKCFEIVASHYITEDLPNNWDKFSEHDLDQFLEKYAYESVETLSGGEINEIITGIASDIHRAMHE